MGLDSIFWYFFDGFMAITTTMLFETEGVGPFYSGTALGIVFTIAQVGSVIYPPLGNSLAHINPGFYQRDRKEEEKHFREFTR
jgi:hypothetical protein